MIGNADARGVLRNVMDSGDLSIAAMSPQERVVFLICTGFDFVAWAGFELLFYCDWAGANDYAALLAAHRRIGAARAADLLERTATLFPGGWPPADYRLRRRHLKRIRGFGAPAGTLIGRLQDAYLAERETVSAGLSDLLGDGAPKLGGGAAPVR